MIIATFGPTTAWVGKGITYDDGRFTLDELGQITAQAVVEYDRQGHLTWAYDGLREWTYQTAGLPAPSVAPETPAAAAPAAGAPVAAAPVVAPQTTSTVPPQAPLVAPQPVPAAAPETPPVAAPAPEATAVAAQPPQPPLVPPAAAGLPMATPTQVAPPPAGPPPAGPPPAGPPPAGPPPAGVVVAAAPQPPKSSSGWLGWVITGVVVLIALLIGIAATGGRLRDGLGIALTLLAVFFVVLLIVVAIRPGMARRLFSGLEPRTFLIISGILAAGCFAFAAVLWWMPHYEVIAPGDKRIALDDTPEMTVRVVNRGLIGGTYDVTYSVDGVEQDQIQFPLGAGDGREVTVSLPGSAERGDTLISLGGASIEAKAVAPPEFVVAPLQLDPEMAKLGDSVTLKTTVENVGDIEGTFSGVLLVDGNELMTQPVDIGAGATKTVTYDLTADEAGEYRMELGDAATDFVIVKPVRLSNGHVVKRSAKGGRAYITVKNKTGEDAMVVLTRTGSTKPVLAVYVRDGQKAKVEGIPDGKYTLWDCCGTDWNWYMGDFYTATEYKRWITPLKFDTTASTKSWTSYWSDSSYNYSQKHSQTTTHWTNWTVTLGTGESKYTKTVTVTAFPKL